MINVKHRLTLFVFTHFYFSEMTLCVESTWTLKLAHAVILHATLFTKAWQI